MSYSRWSCSSWYVFWDSSLSGKLKEDQSLACWYSMDDDHMISWSYLEIDNLLKRQPDYIIKSLELKYGCSPDEANELQEHMQQFRTDVNRQYIA